jgi:pimeloyl-ACP methyl ester carboxylesterase
VLAAVLAATAALAVAPAASAGMTRSADAELTRFHRQRVDWTSCQRGAGDADGRALDEAGVQCADIQVPLDYSRPGGRTIAVAIARSKATDPAHHAGPLILNLGGPSNPVLSTVPLARAAKLSFLGYSQGSYLGAQYLRQFPRQAGRMVLDSVIDPDQPGVTILADPALAARRTAALREWAGLAAQHDAQLHLGSTTEQVLDTVDRVYQASAHQPLRVGPYLVDDTVIPGVIANLLADDSEERALELAATVRVLRQAVDTGSAEPTPDLASTLAGQLTGRDSAPRSAATAVQCGDAPVSRDVEAYCATSRQDVVRLRCSARWAPTSRRARSGRTRHGNYRAGSAPMCRL